MSLEYSAHHAFTIILGGKEVCNTFDSIKLYSIKIN